MRAMRLRPLAVAALLSAPALAVWAQDFTVNQGNIIQAVLVQTVSTKTNKVGDKVQAQCPSGDCRSNAPGGICGCGGATACSSKDFDCGGFAACVLDCKTDTDCFTGMRCTTSGCALKPCTADGECPSITVCRPLGTGTSKYCQRKLCPDGTGCPSGTTCLTSAEGKSCVEDYLTF